MKTSTKKKDFNMSGCVCTDPLLYSLYSIKGQRIYVIKQYGKYFKGNVHQYGICHCSNDNNGAGWI